MFVAYVANVYDVNVRPGARQKERRNAARILFS